MKMFLSILPAAALLWGCQKNPFPETHESNDQKIARWHNEAKTAMLTESTNRVPGINRIILNEVENRGQSVTSWRGHVTLDFVNHLGGIDRTNLYYLFTFPGGHVSCFRDGEREYQLALEAIRNRVVPEPIPDPRRAEFETRLSILESNVADLAVRNLRQKSINTNIVVALQDNLNLLKGVQLDNLFHAVQIDERRSQLTSISNVLTRHIRANTIK